jgi:hypothetical protein
MISFAVGMSLLWRGARWGDLEVLDLDDIEAQIAKNPMAKPAPKPVAEPMAEASPLPKSKPCAPDIDLEAGWSVVRKKTKAPKASKPNANRTR